MNKLTQCRGAARRDAQSGSGNRVGWSDLRCVLCRSIVQSWKSRLPKPSVGWCSWCFKCCDQVRVQVFCRCSQTRDLCIVQVLLKESVIGSDVLCCSSCQRHTRKCTSCRDGYTWGNGILSSLQCAVCVGSIRSWSNLESPAVSEVSAICSWCLQKSVHHLVEKNTLRRSVCASCHLFQVYFALIPVASGTAAPCVMAAPSNVRSARTIWPAAVVITTTNCAYNANRFLLSPHLSSLERACLPCRK